MGKYRVDASEFIFRGVLKVNSFNSFHMVYACVYVYLVCVRGMHFHADRSLDHAMIMLSSIYYTILL